MNKSKTTLVASALIRPMLEPQLPDTVEAHWFASKQEALDLAPLAEIGWFDLYDKQEMFATISAAKKLKWLNSIYAGVDGMPLDMLAQQGTMVTNGAGLLSDTMAEYALLGILSVAKGYDKVMAAQARREWLPVPPATGTLVDAKVLIVGYGAIGQEIEKRLLGCGAVVSKVRRSGGDGVLSPDEWRGRLSEFDWIVVAAPSTPETKGLIGPAEFAAMKDGARLANIARGPIVDTEALTAALKSGKLAAAYLDVTDPEPLPADHPLWTMENVQISMHLSGPSQTVMFPRAASRFLTNLDRYQKGEPLAPLVDLTLGY